MIYGVAHSRIVDMAPYIDIFQHYSDEVKVFSVDEEHDPDQITFALLWAPVDDFFDVYTNVKIVASIAAGVDNIMSCPSLRSDIKVCRNRDDEQAAIMSTFVIWHVLNHQRNFPLYLEQQHDKKWKRLNMRSPSDISIGVLGLGFLGERIASDLSHLGFPVCGWRKKHKDLSNPNIKVFSGKDSLPDFLNKTEVLICVLPLTNETKNILNINTFRELKPNAYLINLGRGGHLVEEDLFKALDEKTLKGASLDVFNIEPLPKSSLLWTHLNIIITPHVGSDVAANDAVKNIINELRRYHAGNALHNQVEINVGY